MGQTAEELLKEILKTSLHPQVGRPNLVATTM